MIARAVELLRLGKLVAFPTETVYGLGADATNAEAIRLIFAAKGRPSTNPLICHVASESMARKYARIWPDEASAIARAFWPGPITMVLPKQPSIPPEATAGRDTVGLRAPDHPLTLGLLNAFDKPIAGPSANKSNHISPTTAQHVREELGDAVDLILDGGACDIGIESTVIDLSGKTPTILRPGGISRAQIESILGPVDMQNATVPTEVSATSPGQHARHYAPRTRAIRVASSELALIPREGRGFILLHSELVNTSSQLIVRSFNDPADYARGFYSALRFLDAKNLVEIIIEMPPDTPAWSAIRDRITRATMG